mgnify:CR=1 FL=1
MSHKPFIGTYVLETLTTGMYTNPLDTLREFIQNAADSIRTAEEEHLIREGAGRIEVTLNPTERIVKVRDNGVGIPSQEVANRLLNIGTSTKTIEKDAGFRGIGRLAGIAYCKALHFRTSAVGENTTSEVKIDCDGIRNTFSPELRQVSRLEEAIANYSSVTREPCDTDSHFFEVTMNGILEQVPIFLNWRAVEGYLSQVAPVKYDAQRFIFATKIQEWVKQYGLSIPTVTLIIKTPEIEREVFKPYKSRYGTRRSKGIKYELDIEDVCFYPEVITPESTFWLWYGKTQLLGMIDDTMVAGLRLRKNNIAIGGPDRVRELFEEVSRSYGRFNSWYIGEIHIISPHAIPNARRDGFEDTGIWPEIKKELIGFVEARAKEAYTASGARNQPTQKVITSAKRVIDKVEKTLAIGIASAKERDNLLKQVDQERKRVTDALKHRKNQEDVKTIEPYLERLNKIRASLKNSKPRLKKFRSDLGRKQRKVISEVLEVLFEVLDEVNFEKAKAAILARFQVEESKTGS